MVFGRSARRDLIFPRLKNVPRKDSTTLTTKLSVTRRKKFENRIQKPTNFERVFVNDRFEITVIIISSFPFIPSVLGVGHIRPTPPLGGPISHILHAHASNPRIPLNRIRPLLPLVFLIFLPRSIP